MIEPGLRARIEPLERPGFAAAAVEDLLTGAQRLRQAFLQTPMRFARRDTPLARAGDPEPAIFLLHSGFAYRSCPLADGRRAILDILVPGDVTGLDHIVLASPIEDIAAADRVSYRALGAAAVRALMADPPLLDRDPFFGYKMPPEVDVAHPPSDLELKKLWEHYKRVSDKHRAKWVEEELMGFHLLHKPSYNLDVQDVPPPSLEAKTNVREANDLYKALDSHHVGDSVDVTVENHGHPRTVKVTLQAIQ